MSPVNGVQYSILSFVGLAFLFFGMLVFSVPVVSVIGLVVILTVSSSTLSRVFSEHLHGTGTLLGLLLALSYIMIVGSLIYYAWTVTAFSIFLLLASLPLFGWFVPKQSHSPTAKGFGAPSIIDGILISVLVLALVSFFVMIFGNASIEPTRSPWLILGTDSLNWLALASVSALSIARRSQIKLAILASTATLFALVSIVLIMFPLGYGFDPFLHQATVEHIITYGTITPKPFYYIGQYAIEFVLTFTSGFTTHQIDIFLLPILSSIILPTVAAGCVWQITKRSVPTALAATATLLLPLAPFINTTPQGVANLWSLIILFLALPELVTKHRWVPHWVLFFLTIATLLVHPLAGLPIGLFVVLFAISNRDDLNVYLKRTLLFITAISGAVMLPVAFSISGTSKSLGFHPERIIDLIPQHFFSTRFQVIGDLLAYIGINGWIWYFLLTAVAGAILWNMRSRRWMLLPATSGLLIVNAIILSVAGDFSFLIDYEQTNYISRVMLLALYVILPLSILGLALGIERLMQMKNKLVNIATLIFFATAVMANGYYTYPRHDAYSVSRGFTIGQSDHDTVASVRSDAGDTPYIVLANQAVSAAAIQDFGFAPYYGDNNDVFYYPVPTAGPMYQIFLEMIEENPTIKLATDAMNLAGVDRAYFVVNDYWWSSEVASERAKVEAESWFSVEDGATNVFIYNRSQEQIEEI